MAGVITKVISYIGCEVRLSDCYRKEVKTLSNCSCWEKIDKSVRDSIKAGADSKQLFCPVCQSPVDKDVTNLVLKFHAQGKGEAEQNPEAYWPRVLATATDKMGGTSHGYRVFPAFEKGTVRRDVVLFGLPVWQVAGGYNAEHPVDPASSKFDEVKAWLTKLGIFHKDSFKLRLYVAQEPAAPVSVAPTKVE